MPKNPLKTGVVLSSKSLTALNSKIITRYCYSMTKGAYKTYKKAAFSGEKENLEHDQDWLANSG